VIECVVAVKSGADQILVTSVDTAAVPDEDLVDRLLVEQRVEELFAHVCTN
jgi:hypothetical protein